MTGDDAFLAAIIAAPTDDLPRLVYADYLDEQGDHDRAEFIRLQIAGSQGHLQALARSEQLLQANRDKWIIRQIHGVQMFRRGFVEAIHIAAEEFVAHADRIGCSAPVTALRLAHSGPYLDTLIRVPWLSRLDKLDLTGNLGIGYWLNRLLTAVPLPNLQSLILRNNQLGAEAVDVLAEQAVHLQRLIHLNLSGNPIGDYGMIALADRPSLGGLTELVLRCDQIPFNISLHATGAAALAGSQYLTRLRHLDLAGHYIGDAGLIELVRSANVRFLEYLDVSNNEIGELGDSGIEALVESPNLEQLRVLHLGRNTIGRIGAEALAHWPRLEHMTLVDLSGCELSELARAALLASPYHHRFVLDEPTLTV